MNNNYKEIERKFLIKEFPSNLKLIDDCIVEQGYLYTDDNEVRIRYKEDLVDGSIDYVLSIKSSGDLDRVEIETYVSRKFFNSVKELIGLKFINKEFKTYELDNFILEVSKVDPGTNNEFMYAEIEFESINDAKSFDPSLYPILDKEVTYDDEYKMKNYWNRTRKEILAYKKPAIVISADKTEEFINHSNPEALHRIDNMAKTFEKEMGIKRTPIWERK